MFNIIDLGTSKITGITVKESNGMQKVVGFSSKSTAGLKKGSIINITETSKTIAEVVEDLQNQSGENIRVVDVSFSGELISSTNSTGLATISDKEVSVKDQQSALQTSIAMNVPGDKELLNVVPSQYIIDGQPGIKEPKGMTGVRLEVRTHLVYCSKNSISNISKCIEEINGLQINKFYFNQLGAAKCTLSEDQIDLGVCLLDIGAGTTDLTVFKNGSLIFSKVLPYAGDYITESIAIALKIPSSQAEELKKRYGSSISDRVTDESLKIRGIGGETDFKISKRMLCEVIEQSISNIFRSCIGCIEENGLQDSIPAGFILSGGTANLENIEELGSAITQNSFKIGYPENEPPLNSEKLIKPQFGAPLGMVKFCAEEQNKEFTFNQSKGIIARVLDWLKSEM